MNSNPSFSPLAQLITVVLSISLLIGQFGCATSKSKPYTPPVLSDEFRGNLGTIGLVSVGFPPNPEFHKPMGKGAAASAGAKAGGSAMFGGIGGNGGNSSGFISVNGDALELLLAIALVPVGAVVGGIVGAVRGVPTKKINDSEDTLYKAVAGLKVQTTLRDYIFRAGQESSSNHLIPLDLQQCYSISDSEKYGEMMITESSAKMQEGRFTSKDDNYHFLADQGIDTVLETAVLSFGLCGDEGMNPPLVFCMALCVRLVRTSDGSVLYMETFGYRSKERKFTEWASDNARPFSEEFGHCYENLAKQVVHAIFATNNLPSEPATPSESE